MKKTTEKQQKQQQQKAEDPKKNGKQIWQMKLKKEKHIFSNEKEKILNQFFVKEMFFMRFQELERKEQFTQKEKAFNVFYEWPSCDSTGM